ncbi:MAG: 50S ribosomal L9 C-terminal domain-containing protein, partial [Chloroflexota bacterium]|nr:50S ribosomal L9 C-terminal domain-containing protein [Chloroflexota bacterium]
EIEVRTGPTGRLYGSITPAIIAEALAEKTGRDMDRRYFNITDPIRVIGKFKVFTKFVEEVSLNLTLNIIPDEESVKAIEEHKIEQEKLKKLAEKEASSEENSEENLEENSEENSNNEENTQKTSSEIEENEDNKSNN